MFCSNCGNELKEGDNFCGRCGTGINNQNIYFNKETANTSNERLNKDMKKYTKIVLIGIPVLVIVLSGLLILMINIDRGSNDIPKPSIKVENEEEKQETISQSQMIKILENSKYGIYLQKETVKVGTTVDINCNSYDKLISYSCIFINGQIKLDTGGLILYNTKDKDSSILTLDNSLMSIIYYLNNENITEKLINTSNILAKYISNYGIESITVANKDTYIEMGKEIGQVVGVRLCRTISEQALELLDNKDPRIMTFLYKKDEIFPRYVGFNVTTKEFCWNVLPEDAAKKLSVYNKETYNKLIALYGEPYKDVTKFKIFDFIEYNENGIGIYADKKEAKEKLDVEERIQ